MDQNIPPQSPQIPPQYTPSETSGTAITSLVLGVASFFCSIFTGLPAILLGIIALGKIDRSQGRLSGKGLAIAGIVTGALSTLLMLPVMVALLLPAVQAARDAAQRAQSTNNMKQIELALMNYHDQKREYPPTGAGSPLSWRVHILPYVEGQALYEKFHLDEPWDSAHNLEVAKTMPQVYKDTSGQVPDGKTPYLLVTGAGSAFGDGSEPVTLRDFRDGASNTIVLVEVDPDQAVEWTKPDDWQFDPNNPKRGLGGARRNGFLAGTGDGAVHFIETDTPDATVKALMTRDGGETIGPY